MRDPRDDKSSHSISFSKILIFDLLMAIFSFFRGFSFFILYYNNTIDYHTRQNEDERRESKTVQPFHQKTAPSKKRSSWIKNYKVRYEYLAAPALFGTISIINQRIFFGIKVKVRKRYR